jgi:transcriptional regulator with XRE-family HTH domain
MNADDFVGTRIRKLREAKGLSAMALQRLTGLSQATLYRAEQGGVVSPRTAEKLSEALRCRASDLLKAGGGR